MEFITELVESMKPLLEQYGYLALVVSIALEGIGIPMPGQSLLIVASILSTENVMDLNLVMIVAWLSCFLGNTGGYFIGFYFESWLDKKGYISGPRMQKLNNYINRYGPICLVVSRFVEGMKQFMPMACGIAKMSRKEFFIGNALASTIWVGLFSLLISKAFEHVHLLSHLYTEYRYIIWAICGFSLLAMILMLIKRKKYQ